MRLLSEGPCNILANPPGCVGAEPIAFFVIKFFYGMYKTEVPLLYKVHQVYTKASVFSGNMHNQAQFASIS